MNYVEGNYGTAQTSLMTNYAGNMLSLMRALNAYLAYNFAGSSRKPLNLCFCFTYLVQRWNYQPSA